MPTLTLSKEDAISILDEDYEGAEILLDVIYDKRRWAIQHEIIFSLNNKFWRGYYSVAATENQDESPWEYDKEVNFAEVEPYQVTITKYKAVL